MTDAPGEWVATLRVRSRREASADRLLRALGPEAEREVPRARSSLSRASDRAVELTIRARDTSSLRAALNTYLGWVELVVATERVAEGIWPPEALI